MNFREQREALESKILSKYATLSKDGTRDAKEEECSIRTSFQRDRDRILHSKSFRRLKHKTQVFIAPRGDHFRTRLTHTLEVSQIGRTIARALMLNEDLVEAMALGHDLGHTPFGHSGENVLAKLNPNGFHHNIQSLRVVEFIERREDTIGLNLTKEVRDGIKNHTGDKEASTLEGKLIKYADRIAYINHDIDDAIRAGIITKGDLPEELIEILGDTNSKRINTMITAIIDESFGKDRIKMTEEKYQATMALRQFMFDRVYLDDVVKSEEDKIGRLLTELYQYFSQDILRIPKHHLDLYENLENKNEIVTDYIAGMTDRFAVDCWKSIFVPKSWGM